MSRRLNAALVVAACAVLLPGCGKRGETPEDRAAFGGVDAVVGQLNSFTAELTGAVESTPDTSAGVSAAQKLLDSRKAELAAGIAALKGDAKFRQDAAAKRKWLEAEVDDTQRVSQLRVKYADASLRDPAFKARLDKLVADYDAMFRDSAEH
ncbi:MAG: hypothetical protein DMF67_16170 [Acidobacteria bacterium]|nr:MAG: hypothetical protein DMF66_03795 [Acidobacteriota bacterium]PYS81597.1 MAG: hypothetical protein DMF67_16170 [Acidobacteriota bacterium]